MKMMKARDRKLETLEVRVSRTKLVAAVVVSMIQKRDQTTLMLVLEVSAQHQR